MTLRFDEQETATQAQATIATIRALAMDAVERAGCGHPGLPLAMAPLAYVLYGEVLEHDPADPEWPDRDRFILSAGHASMLLYAVLHLAGYDVALDELRRFRQWGSRTPGHPERHPTHGTPGVETTTGPLGQGFANGVGMAMAERFLRERYGEAIVDHRTYALCSDGDLMEGVSAEAASLAGHLGLGRLIYVYDDNRITIDGSTELAFSGEDVDGRFGAYGWHVQVVDDANDLQGLRAALATAREELERPSLIRVRSVIGWPAPTKAGTPAAHGAALGPAEVRATKERLGIDPDAEFDVPAQAYEAFRPAAERGAAQRAAWSDRVDRWRLSDPRASVEWDAAWAGRPTGDIAAALPRFDARAGDAMATRTAAGKAMAAFGRLVPTMVGGAADLAESTKTVFAGERSFSRRRAGRNVHWGVREHAMGAAVNGLALHGGILRPYGATFLAFADYMRPAIRLSALMRLRVAWVFTHDSVGLGEDGPTHQPVEHLAALRAIPGLVVLRPADAVEAAHAWRVALEDVDGPVCLVLTRQDVPVLDRTRLDSRGDVSRGGYVLAEAPGGDPEVILVASGSEVAVALEARSRLERHGVAARVVSMPSWEIFEAQDRSWRDTVLPPAVSVRVCVEAGTGLGWERYAGPDGEVVSIERFGASAPGAEVLERLGVTPHRVVRGALASLERERRGAEERIADGASRSVATHVRRDYMQNIEHLEQTARFLVAAGKGILAADESTGTMTRRLEAHGLASTAESRRRYREMLLLAPGLEKHISGAILYDETFGQAASDGRPFPRALAERGILPGIKVDTGAKPLAGAAGETVTEGLDGLRERLAEYGACGARFAKWRAVIAVDRERPTDRCVEANAHALACYAALCQEAGIVPIVEPEVLMDGDHSIERCAEVTERVQAAVFAQLAAQGVRLEGIVLKPNMVVPGTSAVPQVTVAEVAEATVRVLRRTVPSAVPGIAFLSGGQSPELATAHLQAMAARGPHPWQLTFSYGRALQDPALEAWSRDETRMDGARDALLARVRANGAARDGAWSPEADPALAA